MQGIRTIAFGGVMLSLGYLLGNGAVTSNSLTAQDRKSELSDETTAKIRGGYTRLEDAMESLKSSGKYEAITKGANTFLILSGGGNAREDLESGRGVDPETFAGLYAGQALPEIQEMLSKDDQGRITYNNEVVRIYSQARLDRCFAERTKLTEVAF